MMRSVSSTRPGTPIRKSPWTSFSVCWFSWSSSVATLPFTATTLNGHTSKIFEVHPRRKGGVQINLTLDASTHRAKCFITRQRDRQAQAIVIDQAFTRTEIAEPAQERSERTLSAVLTTEDVQALQVSVRFGKQLINHG